MLPIELSRWGVFARDRQQTDSAPLTDRRRAKQRAKLESPSLRLQALPRIQVWVDLHSFASTATQTALRRPRARHPSGWREPDPIRNAVPLPSAHALNAGPLPGPTARIKRAGTTTTPGWGWQRGDEDDRWISVEEMPGAVAGSKDTDRHSIPLLHHAIDAVIRRGVHSSD